MTAGVADTLRRRSPQDDFFRTALMAALAATAVFAWRYLGLLHHGAPFAEDFAVFYRAAQSADPRMLYADANHGGAYHPFLNAPFFLFVLRPLAAFDAATARALFFVAQLVAWLGALAIARPAFPLDARRYWLAALLLPFPFLLNTIFSGQAGIFYAALLLMGVTQRERKPLLAGAAFGLLACKPTLALMVPVLLIAGKNGRTLFACAATVVFLSALASGVWGMGIWPAWAQAMAQHAEAMRQEIPPQKFLTQMASLYGGLRRLGVGDAFAMLAQALVAVGCVACLVQICRRRAPEAAQRETFLVVTFLASPYMLMYDLPALSAVLLGWVALPPTATRRLLLPLFLFLPMLGPMVQAAGVPLAAMLLLAGCGVVKKAARNNSFLKNKD